MVQVTDLHLLQQSLGHADLGRLPRNICTLVPTRRVVSIGITIFGDSVVQLLPTNCRQKSLWENDMLGLKVLFMAKRFLGK